MENTSKTGTLAKRDIFYFRQRQKNRVFADICAFFAEEAAKGHINKRKLAEKISCDPALITRWLSAPSNLTLDTISDLLLGLDAEMDHRIVRFKEREIDKDIHPLAAPQKDITQMDDLATRATPGPAPGTMEIKILEDA